MLFSTSCDEEEADAGDMLTCLRGGDVVTLSDVFDYDSNSLDRPNPVVDGMFIQDLGSKEMETGNFVKVPLFVGIARDEGTWRYYGA